MIYIPFLTELRRIASALERSSPIPVAAIVNPEEAISYEEDAVVARRQLQEEWVRMGLANPPDPLDEEFEERPSQGPHGEGPRLV